MRRISLVLALALGFTAAPAAAQAALRQDPPGGAEAAREAADDLEILRALVAAKLSGEPLRRLLPPVENAHRQLQQRERLDTAELQRYLAPLQVERRQALAGQRATTATEERYRQAVAQQEQRRAELTEQLTASLLRQLTGLLTAEQLEAVAAAGQELARDQRQLALRSTLTSGIPSPLSRLAGGLDQIRDIPPLQWDLLRQALTTGNLGALMVNPPGGGDPPTGQRPPVNLDDPQLRAALEQVVALGDRARGLDADQYQAQKGELTADFMEQLGQVIRAGRGAFGDPVDPRQEREAALRRFIERTLLHPRAPALIREKLGAAFG